MGKSHKTVNKKIVLIGDPGTGKSSILKNINSLNRQTFISEQITANKYELKTRRGKLYTRISIWDGIVTGYKTDYRPIAYKDTDLIVILYALDSFKSFQNIEECWIREREKYAPNTPVVILGNKSDMKGQEDVKLVTSDEGLLLAKKIRASCFIECTAFSEDCLDGLVQELTDIVLQDCCKNKKKECTIM